MCVSGNGNGAVGKADRALDAPPPHKHFGSGSLPVGQGQSRSNISSIDKGSCTALGHG